MKDQKTVRLEKDILDDIRKKARESGFNFSEWVSNEYRNKFMSINSKKAEIESYQKKIFQLENEINDIFEREETVKSGLGRNEKRFLLSVPILIKEGKEWKALCNRFNITFSKSFSLDQFKKNVKYLERKNNGRS